MAFTLLNQLIETFLTPGNVHQFAGKEKQHLTDREEFKHIQSAAPDFAKKLALAWDGDSRDFERSQGKNFDPLFPKMLDSKSVAKFAPDLKIDQTLEKQLGLLKQLHSYSFPNKTPATRKDSSVWSNERWAKESQDFDMVDYEMLREEVDALFEAKEPPKLKKFPDTKAGIISFLQDADEVKQSFTKSMDLKTCQFMADPQVEGVWAVDSLKLGTRLIVYLGGYRDPHGEVRPYNDFEEGQIPKRELKRMLDREEITQKQYDKFITDY